MSPTTDASGGDAAPIGREPPPLAGGPGALANAAAGGGRRYRTAPYALFQEQEDTRGYLSLLQGIIERRGVPMAVYTDGHAVFQPTASSIGPIPGSRERTINPMEPGPGRTGDHPDIGPQSEAKGRVERANGTFQDRLVAELRLAGACTLAEANQVLADFLPRFNQRFGVPADQAESAYRPVNPELDLGGVLCIKELRRVAKTTRCNTAGGLCNSFPVWSAPAMPGPE